MLGSSLCRQFYGEHIVYALHRDDKSVVQCRADYSLDLTDSKQVRKLFDYIEPDVVIHCAGLTSVDACEEFPAAAYEANVTAADNIARFCGDDAKLIYISTDQVYGVRSDHSEQSTNLKPINQYGITKLDGEQKVQDCRANNIIVRTNIFGWNGKPGRVSSAEWIYHSLKNRRPLNLFTDYYFSPIYSECLGDIILKLVALDFTGVVNVGALDYCSKYDFGLAVAAESGLATSSIKKSRMIEFSFAAKRPSRLELDTHILVGLGIIPPRYEWPIKKFSEHAKARSSL